MENQSDPTSTPVLEYGKIAGGPSGRREHLPGLDGLRGIAVLMVMFHHWTFLELSTNRFDLWLGKLLHGGWAGVDFFFVLSGFLITGILLDSCGRPNFFRDFYARRTLRIFPLYYAFLFAFVVLPAWRHRHPAYVLADLHGTWWYWTYTSNFLFASKGFYSVFLDPTWSLAVEEQFYLLWPLAVLITGRRRLPWLCVALILLGISIRMAMAIHGSQFPAEYVLLPTHMDGLLIGALLAVAARSAGGLASMKRVALVGGLVGVAVIAAATAVAWSSGVMLREDVRTQAVTYTAIAAVAGATLVWAACAPQSRVAGRFFGNAILRRYGKYSYAMYLLNRPLMEAYVMIEKKIRWQFIGGSLLEPQIVRFVVCSIAMLMVGWVSWNFYEKWFLKLKRFFPAAAFTDVLPESPR
jgi:peptidoglycan/LPS O-acetylase OafA/YrhL